MQLDLAGYAFENAGPTSHSQVRVFIGQVRSLYRYVAVLAKVKAVDGLIPVSIFLWYMLDQYTDTSSYT